MGMAAATLSAFSTARVGCTVALRLAACPLDGRHAPPTFFAGVSVQKLACQALTGGRSPPNRLNRDSARLALSNQQRRSLVKILVPLKRVADPDNANKIKVAGGKVDTTGLEWKPNPFDEYAVETALRLTENGANPKARLGEVVVVTFGAKDTETTLRAALATGADRAIRVDATDDQLDGDLVARALKAICDKE